MDLSKVPGKQLESAINFNTRHKSGALPEDYLARFLEISRQFGYATTDDSWGELEKELTITFRNLVKYRRALAFIAEALHGSENDETFDAILELGEEHWAMKRDSEERIKAFRNRLDAIQRAA